MKITLDCIIFGLQPFGGISTYWSRLINYLSHATDVELTLRLPRRPHVASGLSASPSSAVSKRVDALPARIGRYLPLSVDDTADLFHSSYYRNPMSSRTRSIVTVHDFIYEKFSAGAARLVHSTQKFSAIRRANGLICVSENTRRDLLGYVSGIDPERVTVIPLGVDAEQLRPPTADEVDRSLSDIVLFVGMRSNYKRFDLAVEAVRPLKELRLGIVGPPLSRMEIAFLDRALDRRWIAFGAVPGEKLRILYGSCFGLIYPSSYEGFGLPTIEAMSCGAPTVVAKLSSIPEVGGSAAVYAENQTPEAYTDALRSLLSPGIRSSKIREGSARAKLFSWERTFSQTLEFYKRVMTQQAGLR